MRVLHLTRDFPPRINGGLSTAVGGLVRASREAGIDGRVISFDAWRPHRPVQAPVREQRFAGVSVLRISAPEQLAEAAAWAGQPDVVHVHDALLWAFARELRGRRIFSLHVAQAAVARLRGLDTLPRGAVAETEALAEADCVTVPSPALAAMVPRDVRIAPLGVHPEPPLSRHPIPGRVLFVGRFADIKGLDELAEAFRTLPEPAHLVVAGGLPDSPKQDRRWRRRLQAALGERLTLAGWLDDAALRKEHARAALLVVPSWFETFGLAALEAMQRGVPIVATRTPGLSALVEDGESGLLVPPRDPASLARALAGLLADASEAETLGRAAASSVRTHWLWRDRIAPWQTLYRT